MSLNPTPSSIPIYTFPGSALTAIVSTDQLQSNGTVTGKTDGTVLKVTRIAALALEWVIVDPGELLGGRGRHAGRPIRTQQWVEVASSDGVTPLSVLNGQSLLVEMHGVAPTTTPDGGIADQLTVQTGIPGDDFTIPITLEVGNVEAVPKGTFPGQPFEILFTVNTPETFSIGSGLTQYVNTKWAVHWKFGPPVAVSFSLDTADTGGFSATFSGGLQQSPPMTLRSGNAFVEIPFDLVLNTPSVLTVGSNYTVYHWMSVNSLAGGGGTILLGTIPVTIIP